MMMMMMIRSCLYLIIDSVYRGMEAAFSFSSSCERRECVFCLSGRGLEAKGEKEQWNEG